MEFLVTMKSLRALCLISVKAKKKTHIKMSQIIRNEYFLFITLLLLFFKEALSLFYRFTIKIQEPEMTPDNINEEPLKRNGIVRLINLFLKYVLCIYLFTGLFFLNIVRNNIKWCLDEITVMWLFIKDAIFENSIFENSMDIRDTNNIQIDDSTNLTSNNSSDEVDDDTNIPEHRNFIGYDIVHLNLDSNWNPENNINNEIQDEENDFANVKECTYSIIMVLLKAIEFCISIPKILDYCGFKLCSFSAIFSAGYYFKSISSNSEPGYIETITLYFSVLIPLKLLINFLRFKDSQIVFNEWREYDIVKRIYYHQNFKLRMGLGINMFLFIFTISEVEIFLFSWYNDFNTTLMNMLSWFLWVFVGTNGFVVVSFPIVGSGTAMDHFLNDIPKVKASVDTHSHEEMDSFRRAYRNSNLVQGGIMIVSIQSLYIFLYSFSIISPPPALFLSVIYGIVLIWLDCSLSSYNRLKMGIFLTILSVISNAFSMSSFQFCDGRGEYNN